MSTPATIKTALQAAIAKANNVTGGGDTTVTEAIDSLIDGYGKGGVEPSGIITITQNGTYDVTEKAQAVVEVPASGIMPSGTKEITQNGTYDVTNFASVLASIAGLNAKSYDITVDSDKTSTVYLLQNDHLKSLRDNPNAFVMMRCMNPKASTAMVHFWLTANFTFYYSGTTAYNSIIARATASSGNLNPNTNGLRGDNYNAHLNIDTNGKLWSIPNATYPIKAGKYQIIAGTVEML